MASLVATTSLGLATACVGSAPYGGSSLPEGADETELREQLLGAWISDVPVAGGRARYLVAAKDALVFCSDSELSTAAAWAPTASGDGWLEFAIIHDTTINVQRIRWNDADSFWIEHLPEIVFHRTDADGCPDPISRDETAETSMGDDE